MTLCEVPLNHSGMPLRMELERAKEEGAKRNGLVTAIRRILSERNVFIEDSAPEQQPDSLLTQREMDVLKWLAQGMSREEASIILGISTETVKTHSKSIQVKLDAPNTTGAVSRAYELGILRP